MQNKIVVAILIIVGIITIFPIAVFFSPSQATELYGVSLNTENLAILIRHRGVLLAVLGMSLVAAAYIPTMRVVTICLTIFSKLTFIFLAFTASNQSPELNRVAYIDIGATVLLLIALVLHLKKK